MMEELQVCSFSLTRLPAGNSRCLISGLQRYTIQLFKREAIITASQTAKKMSITGRGSFIRRKPF